MAEQRRRSPEDKPIPTFQMVPRLPGMFKAKSIRIASPSKENYLMTARNAPRRQRRIQEQVATADKQHPKEEAKRAMQAGAREYPAPPFPRQHQSKPGSESDLDPAPL